MEGFNLVWEHAGNLPTEHEIHHPREWIERVVPSTAG
ncbi:MAG: zinc-dependent metalloprotease [Micrococcaceae bacterium]|nr:zinc-dependent metalloprotease [Micrococcaceae bacterium]